EGKLRTFVLEEQQRDERRGGAEADGVGEAVELSAEVGRVTGKSREASIEGIENHRHEDQVRGGDEFVGEKPLGPGIGADVVRIERRDVHRAESADRVAEGRHAREEIDRTDVSASAVTAEAKTAVFA